MDKEIKILALDTSSDSMSVAVLVNGRLAAERTTEGAKNHSITLMPTIDELVREAGLLPRDLTRIVVAQGPGSYTGLRIGVTTAKTLAFTLGSELVGVSSLAVRAASARSDKPVIAIMNARRGYVYAGGYQKSKNVLKDQYVLLSDLMREVRDLDSLLFTGDLVPFKEELAGFDQVSVPVSAYELGRMGQDMSVVEQIHRFNPIYLKRVEAEEQWLAGHSETGDPYVQMV